MLARLLSHGRSGICLRTLGGSRSGEVQLTRLLSNPRVTPAEMVATARAHLLGRVSGCHVLAIQDTTSLRDDGDKHGLYLHPTIAVNAGDGALLGLLEAEFLVRDSRPKMHCNKRRLSQKESRRWVDATCQAGELLAAGAARVTMIGDREADLYDTFARRPERIDVLVRVQHHNRTLRDGTTLEDRCASLPRCGQTLVELPAAPGRSSRRAKLTLRSGRVEIQRPKRNRTSEAAELPESVSLFLVEAVEADPPAGEKPLHWRLLTTHDATSRAQVEQIIAFYRQRWVIEQVFRVMKTQGFDIEAVDIPENAPLKNLACATLIAAITVQQMLHDRDGIARRPVTDVFDPADHRLIQTISLSLEGRTARQKNPHPPNLLAHATWVCARLGGWTGYYGKPGPIVLLRGYLRLQTMIEGVKRSGLV